MHGIDLGRIRDHGRDHAADRDQQQHRRGDRQRLGAQPEQFDQRECKQRQHGQRDEQHQRPETAPALVKPHHHRDAGNRQQRGLRHQHAGRARIQPELVQVGRQPQHEPEIHQPPRQPARHQGQGDAGMASAQHLAQAGARLVDLHDRRIGGPGVLHQRA